MIDYILSIGFQIMLVCLIIKLYHDLIVVKKFQKIKEETSLQDTQLVIDRLEKRNLQLMARESAAQERVWKLEDEVLLLKVRIRDQIKLDDPTPEPQIEVDHSTDDEN